MSHHEGPGSLGSRNSSHLAGDMMEEFDYLHAPETEPIPGYRLLHPLGKGGFGEVWKCEAPGGLHKAIKFVQGGNHLLDQALPAEEELAAIQRVKAIRHPFILSMERVELIGSELVIVMELADKNLADALADEQAGGRQGLPREALLNYMREAAEALDLMNVRHGLQHLDIKPRNLFLVSNHAKVGDFGLVNHLSAPNKGSLPGLGAITPLYACPEVFQGSISRHSDQYSLAIVYTELLTGQLPFTGKNARQLLMQHLTQEPNLQMLPETDRSAVARALAKSPEGRFSSCSDFVQALAAGLTEVLTHVSGVADISAQDTKSTQQAPVVRTIRARTLTGKPPHLPGFEVGELLSRTPLSEVWVAQAGDHASRLVKVTFCCPPPGDEGVQRLSSLRHPVLLPSEVVQHAPGRLVLSTPMPERTLRDLLTECQNQGHGGIPRPRLLALLRPVAEALSFLQQQFGLQHLGLGPRNLVLDGERLLIADFGLAQLVWHATGQSYAQLNARYSAPELLNKEISPSSDQYSFALLYHEMLTGSVPVPAAGRRGDVAPNVDRLPECDRLLIARALHPDPRKRWSSIVELMRALESASAPAERVAIPWDPLPPAGNSASKLPRMPMASGQLMQMRFGATLPAELIRARLDGFRHQWKADLESQGPAEVNLRMSVPQNFWQRFTGRQPGLDIHIAIGAPELTAPTGVQVRTEVRMDLRPRDCGKEQAGDLLKMMGPMLVESLRNHLRSSAGRSQERMVWHHPLQVGLKQPDGSFGTLVDCQGKDISLNGIGFYLPGSIPPSEVLLHLPRTDQTPKMVVPARIVRVQGCGDGWFEVGAVLLPPDELPPEEDEPLD